MSKYAPSLAKNNSLKDDFSKKLNALVYKVEKGKIHSHLDMESIEPIIKSVKETLENFNNIVGTGQENVLSLYDSAIIALKNLEKKFNQELVSQIEESADDLIFAIESWGDVLKGEVEFDLTELKNEKISWSKKKLVKRLEELEQIKVDFSENEKRLEKEIVGLEKDAEELDEIILNEDNERRLNELYRKVTTLNSKIDSLNIRRSSYSACYNLLDLVYVNAKEIVTASDYSVADLGKAKAFLNLGKLKQVISEPEKAISILRQMEKDIKDITEKTKAIDSKILNIDSQATSVSSDALAYKENLMKKKKEKETLNSLMDSKIETSKSKKVIKGDK